MGALIIGFVLFYIFAWVQLPPPPGAAGFVQWGFPLVWRISAGGRVGPAPIFWGKLELDLVFWVGLSVLIANILLLVFRRAPTRNYR